MTSKTSKTKDDSRFVSSKYIKPDNNSDAISLTSIDTSLITVNYGHFSPNKKTPNAKPKAFYQLSYNGKPFLVKLRNEVMSDRLSFFPLRPKDNDENYVKYFCSNKIPDPKKLAVKLTLGISDSETLKQLNNLHVFIRKLLADFYKFISAKYPDDHVNNDTPILKREIGVIKSWDEKDKDNKDTIKKTHNYMRARLMYSSFSETNTETNKIETSINTVKNFGVGGKTSDPHVAVKYFPTSSTTPSNEETVKAFEELSRTMYGAKYRAVLWFCDVQPPTYNKIVNGEKDASVVQEYHGYKVKLVNMLYEPTQNQKNALTDTSQIGVSDDEGETTNNTPSKSKSVDTVKDDSSDDSDDAGDDKPDIEDSESDSSDETSSDDEDVQPAKPIPKPTTPKEVVKPATKSPKELVEELTSSSKKKSKSKA